MSKQTIDEKVALSVKLIHGLQKELATMSQATMETRDSDSGWEFLARWKVRAVKIISSEISEVEGTELRKKEKYSFRAGDPIGNLIDEATMYNGFLSALCNEIERYPREVFSRATPVQDAVVPEVAQPSDKNAIFIVHGHDETNLLRLMRIIEKRWNLQPIQLAEQPSEGRTVIEKFEAEAQRASFVFIMLTPDDFVKCGDDEYSQARPNVIFEMGWFYGRLGRTKVVALCKKGTEIHSDLSGIVRIDFDESVKDVISDMETELINAGLLQR